CVSSNHRSKRGAEIRMTMEHCCGAVPWRARKCGSRCVAMTSALRNGPILRPASHRAKASDFVMKRASASFADLLDSWESRSSSQFSKAGFICGSRVTIKRPHGPWAGRPYTQGAGCCFTAPPNPQMVPIAKGQFTIGSPDGQGDDDEHPSQAI